MDITQQTGPVPMAPEIAPTLAGRRFGLFGFDVAETARIAEILRRTNSLSTRFEESWLVDSVHLGDAVLIKLGAVSAAALRAAAAAPAPVLIVGPADAVGRGDSSAYRWPRDFLVEPWQDAELLVRLFRLVAQPAKVVTHASPRAHPLALLADDDAAWNTLVEATLHSHGYDCRTATEGLTALRLARQLLPDVVLLDVKMPAVDGFGVLQTIRREPLLEQIPVALLTACMNEEEVNRGASLHADDYIVKPISPTTLMNRIKRLLAAASSRTNGSAPSAPQTLQPASEPPRGFEELRSQYLENRTRELAALADALRRADFGALSRSGHNLKGTGAAYGFAELSDLGKALEEAAHSQDAAQVEALLAKTESYLSQVRGEPAGR